MSAQNLSAAPLHLRSGQALSGVLRTPEAFAQSKGAVISDNICALTIGPLSIVNPEAMLGFSPLSTNPVVCAVAAEARVRPERVAGALKT